MGSTIEHPATSDVLHGETEAYQTLLGRAHRRTGAVPPALVVRHVLSVTAEADWPVTREALEALLRRAASGKADGLRIVSRPAGGRLLGLYATRRRGSTARPYRTYLRAVDPIDGSCDCADFLRSSLGLCKHLLAVLEDVVSKKRSLEKARREAAPAASALRWDPIRPLSGPGDWLAQVRWVDGSPAPGLARWLRPAKGSRFAVEVPEAPARRLQLVDKLIVSLRDGRSEPALYALLQEDRRRTMRTIESARDADRLQTALRTLKQRLYPYQRAAVERFLSSGRLVLADDMGLGKTAQAIAACHALWRSGRARRGLIVAPAALKPQWLREWQLFTDTPAAVLDGNPGQRRAAFEACRRGFLLANLAQLLLAAAPDTTGSATTP